MATAKASAAWFGVGALAVAICHALAPPLLRVAG